MCLLFPQEESVCSMCSQSMLTSLVSILQSDSLSDWSICSSFVSPCGSPLPVAGFRNGPSEPSSPACPVAHRTVSLAWRIQLSHCCLLKVSLACSEWVWLWDPFLKLTLKKFLTRNEKNKKRVNGHVFPQAKDNIRSDANLQYSRRHYWLQNVSTHPGHGSPITCSHQQSTRVDTGLAQSSSEGSPEELSHVSGDPKVLVTKPAAYQNALGSLLKIQMSGPYL